MNFRCTYVTEWVVVKVRWNLAVDSAEKSALRTVLTRCPARTVTVRIVLATIELPLPSPSTEPTPDVSPAPSAAPSPAPVAGGCDPNYTGYCVPIVSYDLDCKDIRHRVYVVGVDIHHFDGDGDGVGCESYP